MVSSGSFTEGRIAAKAALGHACTLVITEMSERFFGARCLQAHGHDSPDVVRGVLSAERADPVAEASRSRQANAGKYLRSF
ncbi:MAG: hypothetical protein ACREVC_12280 [Burkholderiales bacterium]